MATHSRKISGFLLLSLVLGILAQLLAGCAGQTADGAAASRPASAAQSEYQQLLAEAWRLSFTLDFDHLRRAFVDSPQYSPYGGVRLKGLSQAYQAAEQADFTNCLRHVDQVLSHNYMSLEAHMIGLMCSGQTADFDREDRHRYMVEGLMESIEKSGDGQSQDTAYQTITFSELRGFVRLKGLQVLEQELVYDNRGVYDKMQVRDPESGSEYPLFFNVSQQFVHGAREAD